MKRIGAVSQKSKKRIVGVFRAVRFAELGKPCAKVISESSVDEYLRGTRSGRGASPSKSNTPGPGHRSFREKRFLFTWPTLLGNLENDAPLRFHPTNGSFLFRSLRKYFKTRPVSPFGKTARLLYFLPLTRRVSSTKGDWTNCKYFVGRF